MNQQWKEDIQHVLVEEVNPHFIILFGSYAKGAARDDSDVDIAYAADRKLSPYERFMVAQSLAERLHAEVDLIDLREADTVFAAQIFSSGELIYCANEDLFVIERMKAYSMYAELNEFRADILQQIDERGRIYEERCAL